MAASKEEVLADFQACTGIDDVGECILHLEETNWNLLDAINRVMPQETQTLPSEQRVDTVEPMEVSSDNVIVPMPFFPLPSTSQPRLRLINFSVEFRDRVIPLSVPDTETVATIKSVLFTELGVPQCKQELRGWKNSNVTDATKLSSLNLPKENTLQLIAPDLPVADSTRNGDDPTISERMNQTFKLNVTDDFNHKQYSVNYLGSKTIKEMKQDMYSLTDIPVRHQVWTGWPRTATSDSMTLASCGVSYPCHTLTVNSNSSQNTKKVVDLTSDSSSAEEFEDANESFNIEDDIFVHDVSRKIRPLMPDDARNETEALGHFINEFSHRYGDCHPMFFLGSLDDALREACQKPARERKLLAVYLHHDGSVLTNVFCTQLLCSETIVSYLTNNFITWAWDLTFEINRANLLSMVSRQFGSVAAQTIRNFNVEQLPLLLLVMRSRSSTEVFTIINSVISLDELMTSLIHAVDVFTTQQQIEIREEEEREARESVKREQDQAYEESLQADRIKEEAKRMEEENRLKKAHEEEQKREKEQIIQEQAAAVKEAIRLSLVDKLPPEPSEDSPQPITQIKIRLPKGGKVVSRRFLTQESLQTVLDFIVVQGYPIEEYKVLTSWPRRDLTVLDTKTTLQTLKLFPQELLTLEER